MASRRNEEVTQVLAAVAEGSAGAQEELFRVVYQELRRLAASLMAGERPDHTLPPTGLVHEAFLRLVGSDSAQWNDRSHFFRTAARAMRRILVDHARGKRSLKRGGDRQAVPIQDLVSPGFRPEEVIWMSEVLDKLARQDPRMAEVVELRYFGGLEIGETARALEVSDRTVNRLSRTARAWLRRELDQSSRDDESRRG